MAVDHVTDDPRLGNINSSITIIYSKLLLIVNIIVTTSGGNCHVIRGQLSTMASSFYFPVQRSNLNWSECTLVLVCTFGIQKCQHLILPDFDSRVWLLAMLHN